MKYADTYIKLADFGRELLGKKTLDEGLPHIARYTIRKRAKFGLPLQMELR